jgi:hypothetical protein
LSIVNRNGSTFRPQARACGRAPLEASLSS